MKRFKVVLSVVVLVVSLSVLVNQLLAPQPIQIILETGQEINTQNPEYFSIYQVLVLVIASFITGSTTIYLYFSSELDEMLNSLKSRKQEKSYEMLISLLKGDEKRVFQEILRSKGEMLQNSLVLKTGLTKVRVTRALAGLERKNLIIKERYGLTNRIKIK
ncbi:MAG: hypothetical protein QW286_03080 [Candidatus Aenigmatarchaeota archaeon]